MFCFIYTTWDPAFSPKVGLRTVNILQWLCLSKTNDFVCLKQPNKKRKQKKPQGLLSSWYCVWKILYTADYLQCPGWFMIWCPMWKKDPYIKCRQWRFRSACTSVQSDLDILCLSKYATISIDSVTEQQRPRSDCALAQADLGLCCLQIA